MNSDPPGQVVLGCIRTQAEQDSEQLSSTASASFLPLFSSLGVSG